MDLLIFYAKSDEDLVKSLQKCPPGKWCCWSAGEDGLGLARQLMAAGADGWDDLEALLKGGPAAQCVRRESRTLKLRPERGGS